MEKKVGPQKKSIKEVDYLQQAINLQTINAKVNQPIFVQNGDGFTIE